MAVAPSRLNEEDAVLGVLREAVGQNASLRPGADNDETIGAHGDRARRGVSISALPIRTAAIPPAAIGVQR